MTRIARSLLAALGMFTVCPVPRRAAACPPSGVVLWLPFVGALTGAAAAAPAMAVWRGGTRGSPLLAAVLVVAVLAALTRGLHLDGLADVADGLGSGRAGPGALEVMKQSDVGPFGVVAVNVAMLTQTAALATVLSGVDLLEGCVLIVLSAVTGRVAVVLAAGKGVPAAREGGFGALVAGSVGNAARFVVTGLFLGVAAASELLATGSPVRAGIAVSAGVLGLVAGWLLRVHAVRRLGGVTGDVFGAVIEVGASTTALVAAIGVVWR